ncbi:hypothetical protein D915_008744 [Fasciola hepatica]|uniref:Uncharacterized protein n=1 Tax=Fasciola hepatica TaxID=6192 RepID=A0A2H1BXM8_FASHE|nr:hypothetical protein D915_008744 [Fasciola hepatica]
MTPTISSSPDDDIHKIRCYDGSERLFRTMGTQFSDADFSKWFSEVTATSQDEVERKPYSMTEVEEQTETEEMAEDLKENVTSNDENSEDIDDDEYAEFGFKRNKQKQVKFASFANEVVQPPVYTDDEYGLSGHSSSEGDREVINLSRNGRIRYIFMCAYSAQKI